MMKLAVGELVGNYRITRFLGRGGFSLVYQGEHVETGETVALKFGNNAGGGRYVTRLMEVTSRRTPDGISPDETPGEAIFFQPGGVRIDFLDVEEIDRLIYAEAELLQGVDSPNIVKVREVIEGEERPVLVLEHVRGKVLREKIRNLEGIHLNWFLAAVRALEEGAAQGGLPYHGDLKPENILIKPSGKVVLIDPAYRCPEKKAITTTPHYNPLLLEDSRADVMAVGIMIYEILTGTLPFDEVPWEYAGANTGGETVRLSLSYFLSYAPPSALNPRTPPELEQIIYKCITVQNYGLTDLRKDLEEFIQKA